MDLNLPKKETMMILAIALALAIVLVWLFGADRIVQFLTPSTPSVESIL